MVEIDKYMDTRTMVTSRGCIGRCKFCNTPYYFGNWSGKGVYDVISEIEMLVSKFNAKKILFLDDNATVDKKRMLKICKKIKEKNIKCLFGVLCSIECYDKYMIQEMYKVGFRWIHFGIESGSELVLSKMNKNMNIEYIKEVIFEVKKIGYRVRTSFILDYPGSKKEDIIKTKNLLLTIKPHEIRLHYLSYRVGTPVFYENKNVLNKSQYIHNNKPNVLNNEISEDIAKLIDELKDEGYDIIIDNIDWNTCNSKKIVSFVPIKYGRFWYE
ncbi:MAG: radical SAM protein [Mollicutes bacterium]|nr:radical SAM protein [Mollicutes bacterium]